jgi:hypothetical protein
VAVLEDVKFICIDVRGCLWQSGQSETFEPVYLVQSRLPCLLHYLAHQVRSNLYLLPPIFCNIFTDDNLFRYNVNVLACQIGRSTKFDLCPVPFAHSSLLTLTPTALIVCASHHA